MQDMKSRIFSTVVAALMTLVFVGCAFNENWARDHYDPMNPYNTMGPISPFNSNNPHSPFNSNNPLNGGF